MAPTANKAAELRAAFKIFDKDGNESLTTDELLEIFMYQGEGCTPFTREDAEELIKRFDKDGNGSLEVEEFVQAFGDDEDDYDKFDSALDLVICEKEEAVGYEKYNILYQKYRQRIDKCFAMLDRDNSQSLDLAEMEAIVNLASPPWDKEAYLLWYDTNLEGSSKKGTNDGKFDRVEFGWYVVDCAEVDADKMDGVVSEFEECVKVLIKRMGAKTMDQLRFGESKTLTGSLATTNVKLAGEEDEGFLAKAGNFFEKVTGVDLDGDGDIGEAGKKVAVPEPEPELEHVPKFTNAIEKRTGVDLDGDGDVGQ